MTAASDLTRQDVRPMASSASTSPNNAMSQRRSVELRRVYDDPDGGHRVLVDRLWPRGVTKADAALDEWLKDAAPSTELRRWYGHHVQRFEEFARRYRAELCQPPASVAVDRIVELTHTAPVTLVTATRDVEHSGARVLEQVVAGRASPAHRRAAPGPALDDLVGGNQSSGAESA